jgi:hypothetical protein
MSARWPPMPATVPGLWRLEIANGLRAAVRRKRIDKAFGDRAIAQLARLLMTVDPDTDHTILGDELTPRGATGYAGSGAASITTRL